MNELDRLDGYGPFMLPKRDSWKIVGTGPSLSEVSDVSSGTIALNGAVSVLPRCDAVILGHYEDVILNMGAISRADMVFMPDPMEVGYKCVKVSSRNLFSFPYLAERYPGKISFFSKESDIEIAKRRPESLFSGPSVALSALWLLFRNGIKKVDIFGIDGGLNHSDKLPKTYKDLNETSVLWFDEAKKFFLQTADYLGIEVKSWISANRA